MSVERRNHVLVRGSGATTLLFTHGFGCDQSMWRHVAPHFESRCRTVLYDLVGFGQSELAAYDRKKYATLQGHAADLLEIAEQFASGTVVLVGHSAGATMGLLAANRAPGRFTAQVMVAPSPCYMNDGDYIGGFTRDDIDGLLETLDANHLGWSAAMAPVIMGAPERPALRDELVNSFCRTDPDIARHCARATFLSDHRPDVPLARIPTLVLQCSDDAIAPRSVGEWLRSNLPDGRLRIVDNVGHCPHLSAPAACIEAIEDFLTELRL